MHRFIVALTLTSLLGLGLAGCQQELGARCQVNTDCSSDLVCNTSTKTCLPEGSHVGDDGDGGIDAPLDGPVVDGPDLDAAIDAAIDAATPIDASTAAP